MNWRELELRECVSFASGGTPNKGRAAYWGGEIPWVSSGEMTRQFLDDTSLRITEEGAEAGSRVVPAGTIFTVVRGMSLAKEFRISFAKRTMAFNQDLKALTAKNGIDSYFLFCSLRAHADQIRDLATEAAHGTKKLEMERLASFRINVPDLDTQKRAADCIRNYDDLIETNRRRIALLDESARLLYREWFVKLRFPGHESVKVVDGVPEGWDQWSIGKFGLIETGKTPSTRNAQFFGGDIPFIKTPDMHDNMLVIHTGQQLTETGSDSQKNKLLPKDTIIVSCIGTVGVVALTSQPSHTNQQINAVIPHETFFRAYLYFSISTLKEYMLGMGGGSTMANISKSKFSSIEISKPPNKLLFEFEETVAGNILQIESLLKLNLLLAQARDALLPKLMSGQLAV